MKDIFQEEEALIAGGTYYHPFYRKKDSLDDFDSGKGRYYGKKESI